MLHASVTLVLAFLLLASATSPSLKYNHHQHALHEAYLHTSEGRVHGLENSRSSRELDVKEKSSLRNLDYDSELSEYEEEVNDEKRNSITHHHKSRGLNEKETSSSLPSLEIKDGVDEEHVNHHLRHLTKDQNDSPRKKKNEDLLHSPLHRTKYLDNEDPMNYDEVIDDGFFEEGDLKVSNQKYKQSARHKLTHHTLEEADEVENRHFHASSLLNDADNMLLNEAIAEDEKLALLHSERVAAAGTCDEPKEIVIHVTDHYPGRFFLPHCTLLHRCGKHSGCCGTNRLKCVAKEKEKVHLHFYSVRIRENGLPPERQIEKLTFTNHTKCGCETL